jgi:ATP-binding cassette subfamily B protein
VTSAHDDEILGKAYDAHLMRRLLTYLRPYWREVGLALVAIIAGAAAQLAQPYLVKLAIDRFIAVRRLDGLERLALAYLAILVAAFALEYLQTWTMQMTGQRIMFDLRMAIYGHLQRLDLGYYDRNPVGRLMTRVTSDVDVLNDLFTSGVVTIFGDVFTLVGIMAVMLGMNWRLALVAFAVLPLIVLVAQWFRSHVRDSYRVVRGLIARINAFLSEHHRDVDGSAVPARGAQFSVSTRSTASTGTPISSRSTTTRCSTRPLKSSPRWRQPSSSGTAAPACCARR